MLPYDLTVLHDYVRSHRVKTLVLAFRDSEAFDQGVLNDLVSLMRFATLLVAQIVINTNLVPGMIEYHLLCSLVFPLLSNCSKDDVLVLLWLCFKGDVLTFTTLEMQSTDFTTQCRLVKIRNYGSDHT
jgi:hypothetical protein